MIDKKTIYLDELNLSSFLKILSSKNIDCVVLLENHGMFNSMLRWILCARGIEVKVSSFFLGDLKLSNDESVMLSAQKMAAKMSFDAARELVNSEPELNKYNALYGRNTILLFIAKQLYYHIAYWTTRCAVVGVLSNNTYQTVWLKKPYQFNSQLIIDNFPSLDITFYSVRFHSFIQLVKLPMLDIAREARHFFRKRKLNDNESPNACVKPSVLLLQEDDIHADMGLRRQPHWLDVPNHIKLFDTWILKIFSSKITFIKDRDTLKESGIRTISMAACRAINKQMKNNGEIKKIRSSRYATYLSALRSRSYSGKYFLLKIAGLQRKAELVGSLALFLKAKVFLVRETYLDLSDAMMIIAPKLNISTIAYQYSNINIMTPFMMTTADKFLVFSQVYSKVFRTDDIMPKKFISMGYLYDGVTKHVIDKSRSHRDALRKLGAKFVICYFNESVQNDRWGLVSESAHLCELHALAKKVLNDNSFGVVVKSQFIYSSPSQMYPDDDLIQKAKQTGRYLELREGWHRNIIYPTEAALVADLCISHKLGATAGLEAAIVGVNTVLLDPYKTSTPFDEIYAQADVVYDDIDSLMIAIDDYRSNKIENNALGDWGAIINHFDEYMDGNSVNRLYKEVETVMSAYS